jgi:long-chain acyl-CoA synthetase
VNERLINFASGLVFNGVAAGQSSLVGLYAKNRAEWIIAEQACNSLSHIGVPLYDTLGKEASLFIIRQAGIKTVITESNKLAPLFEALQGSGLVKIVVSMDENISADLKTSYSADGIKLLTFKQVEKEGKENPTPPVVRLHFTLPFRRSP